MGARRSGPGSPSTAGSRCLSANGSTRATIATPENLAAKILTRCDVYEWIPGRLSVLHTAYGRIGDLDVGGVEIIGFDDQTGQYTSHFSTVRGI